LNNYHHLDSIGDSGAPLSITRENEYPFPVPDTTKAVSLPVDSLVPERKAKIKAHICVDCGEKVTGFKDEISQQEYLISGLCQKCQDSIFEDD
jgi:formylmethanofuran dehydrogenase subunit E